MKTTLTYPEHIKWKFFINQQAEGSSENTPDDITAKNSAVLKQSIDKAASIFIIFLRNTLRLTLKTPIRCIYRPITQKCIWKQTERAKINFRLFLLSGIQVSYMPLKLTSDIIAIISSNFSENLRDSILNKNGYLIKTTDKLMAQCEAFKEEGLSQAESRNHFIDYKNWAKENYIKA